MDIAGFVEEAGGIVHRQSVLDAGVSVAALRAELRRGHLQRVRRYWVATPSAPDLLRGAAELTARIACITAARHRGWWIPPDADERLHLHVLPTGRPPVGPSVVHWNRPLVPVSDRVLVESIADSLEHIAECLPREQALVLWESAVHAQAIAPGELAHVRWRSVAAKSLSAVATGMSGSGIETIFVVRIADWGLPIRQQVPLAGHDVDVLIGELLVVQLDGFAFHSGSAERTRDLAHDRRLVALGYTVLRFSYSEVVYNWAIVEQSLARAIAQGRHRRR